MTTDHDVRQAMLARSSQHGIDVDAVHAGIRRGVRRRRRQRRAATGIGAAAAVAALAVGVPAVDSVVGRTGAPTTSLSPATTATPSSHHDRDRASRQGQDATQLGAEEKFLASCYTWADAEVLAERWRSPSVQEAKATAGRMLIAGQSLPVQPSGGGAIAAGGPVPGQDCDAPSQQQEDFVLEFTNQGYTWADAEELASLWGSPDTLSAKVEAGERLSRGAPLPITPGSTPTSAAPPAP